MKEANPSGLEFLCSEKEIEAIKKLWTDKESRAAIMKEMRKRMMDNPSVQPFTIEQIYVLLSGANDHLPASDEECMMVTRMICKYCPPTGDLTDFPPSLTGGFCDVTEINNKDGSIIYRPIERKDWRKANFDFAAKALVWTGIFWKRVNALERTRAMPSIRSYEACGEKALERIGMDQLSENYHGWRLYLNYTFDHVF